MIGANDWAILFGPEFADQVALTAPDGTKAVLRGIYTDIHSTVAADEFGGGVTTIMPVVTAPAEWLPHWLEADRDFVAVRGKNYNLRDIRPDGSGLARLILERIY